MSISYFGDKQYWSKVTREERLFCSHLYHRIQEADKTIEFVSWLNKAQSPVAEFKNDLKLNANTYWEAAYEVCFYRDLLKSNKISVREDSVRLAQNPNIGEKVENLIKRTFDLALFSNDTIVIIEAKAAGGLTSKQFAEFEEDGKLIKGVFEVLKLTPPDVKFVVLASEKYYLTKAFTTQSGIGRKNIVEKQLSGNCQVDALISWNQLFENESFNDPMYKQAEDAYGI